MSQEIAVTRLTCRSATPGGRVQFAGLGQVAVAVDRPRGDLAVGGAVVVGD
jgi:hypothetical protein